MDAESDSKPSGNETTRPRRNFLIEVACIIKVQTGGKPGDEVKDVDLLEEDAPIELVNEAIEAANNCKEVERALDAMQLAVQYHRAVYPTTEAAWTPIAGVKDFEEM